MKTTIDDNKKVFMTNTTDNDEKFNFLPPERKVRYKLFRMIDKIRIRYKLPSFHKDSIGDSFAMSYAKALLTEKYDENDAKQTFFNCQDYKVSHIELEIEDDDFILEQKQRSKYIEHLNEFVQANSLFIEIESDRENILSDHFNTISIGMAFDSAKVTIVNIFSFQHAVINKLDLNMVNWSCKLSGQLLTDNLGPYVIRIINEEQIGKTAFVVSFEFLEYNFTTKEFSAQFGNNDNKDKMKKQYLELYLREKPEMIKYGSPSSDKVDFKSLVLATRIPYEIYPNPIKEKEIEQELLKEEESKYEADKLAKETKIVSDKEIERMRVNHEKAIFDYDNY